MGNKKQRLWSLLCRFINDDSRLQCFFHIKKIRKGFWKTAHSKGYALKMYYCSLLKNFFWIPFFFFLLPQSWIIDLKWKRKHVDWFVFWSKFTVAAVKYPTGGGTSPAPGLPRHRCERLITVECRVYALSGQSHFCWLRNTRLLFVLNM